LGASGLGLLANLVPTLCVGTAFGRSASPYSS
jgi:hypothetical protein